MGNSDRGEPRRLWPPLLTVLGGLVVGYASFIVAGATCLAESITAFGATDCEPLWTTIGLLVAAVAVLVGSILLLTRTVLPARGPREDGS